ncbi:hypothetical protein EK21DRAFT_117159 [Setomelanomma holmii]|uniref:Uncharacterized protein n=1 Tax=Setomelanomma holmii TaxID=210430 RepID=A0A9P4H007_9PLEO|nr:hypothetical protein EK21DRAFT_117159 [Setomelanomma holmii]
MTTGRQQGTVSQMDQAIYWICRSVEEANEGLSLAHGDYVIRYENVEYAIGKMRWHADSHRPAYDDGGNAHGRCGQLP